MMNENKMSIKIKVNKKRPHETTHRINERKWCEKKPNCIEMEKMVTTHQQHSIWTASTFSVLCWLDTRTRPNLVAVEILFATSIDQSDLDEWPEKKREKDSAKMDVKKKSKIFLLICKNEKEKWNSIKITGHIWSIYVIYNIFFKKKKKEKIGISTIEMKTFCRRPMKNHFQHRMLFGWTCCLLYMKCRRTRISWVNANNEYENDYDSKITTSYRCRRFQNFAYHRMHCIAH